LDSAFDEEIADKPPKVASTSAAASLSYNNKVFVNADTKGNAGEMFGVVLQEMAVSGMLSISNNNLVGNSVPMHFGRNQQLLLNCIELAALTLTVEKKDFELLASSKNSCYKKLTKDAAL
jgi:hypothetical protein